MIAVVLFILILLVVFGGTSLAGLFAGLTAGGVLLTVLVICGVLYLLGR